MTRHEQVFELVAAVVRRVSRDSGTLGASLDLVDRVSLADAVSDLIEAPDFDAMINMIRESPLLRSADAERLLTRVTEHIRTNPRLPPAGADLICNRIQITLDAMRLVRDGQMTEGQLHQVTHGDGADVSSARDESPRALEQHGRRLLAEGRLDAAEAIFHQAVTAARAASEYEVEGDAEIALFKVWMETHSGAAEDWTRMLAHAERAETAYRMAGDPVGLQNALVAQATVLIDQRHPTECEEVLDRLEKHREPVARWWRRYASAMCAHDIDTMLEGLRWCRDSADLLGGQAAFYGQMCEGKVAVLEFRSVTVGPEATPELAAISALLPAFAAAGGDGDAVIQRGEELVRAAEKLRRHTRTQRVQRQLSGTYASTYLLHASNMQRLRGSEQAVDVLEAATNRALLAQLCATELWVGQAQLWSRTEPRPNQLEQVLGRLLANPSRNARSLLLAAFGRERDRRERQEVALLDGHQRAQEISGPLSTRRLRSLLGDNEVVAFYSEDGTIYLINRSGCEKIAEVAPSEVDDVVTTVLPVRSSPLSVTPALRRLSELVVDPVRDVLPAGTHAYLVPNGDLWQLPLGQIGEKPLADSVGVSYVPSLTMLGHLLTAPRLARSIPRFVGFGDPDGSLPHARQELQRAAESFLDVMIRTGEELQFNQVVANMADADILHLACHGLFFPEYPDFSAIHLCGPLHQPQVLWYSDMARLRLNARLVVLAACHAGTGRVLPGSEYIGFPGAFLAAGARAVLAPLWAVDDQVTATLMDHFYRALAANGSITQALRTAQRHLRADPLTAHPRHWAAFQIFGIP